VLLNPAVNLPKVTVAAAVNIHQKLRRHHPANRRSQPLHHRHPSLNRRNHRPIIAAAIIHPVANQVVVVNPLQNPKKNPRNP